MKAILSLSLVSLLVSCNLTGDGGASEESSKLGKASKSFVCEATSEKAGAQIQEKATLEKKDGGYEVVYNFSTIQSGAKKDGKEVIQGKVDASQKVVHTDRNVHAILKDADMVTTFDGRDVRQPFAKLMVHVENGELSLMDGDAVVLRLKGCK